MDSAARLAQVSVIVIGALAVLVAMKLGEAVLAPLVLALVAGIVLSPLADFWERRGYSPVWGAMIGLATTLLLIGSLAAALQPMIFSLVEQAPKVLSDMKEVVRGFRGVLRGMSEVSQSVASVVASEAQAAPPPAADEAVALPTVTDALMIAPAILSQILIFSGTLFFFLMTRSQIYDWVSLRMSERGGRAELAHRLHRADRNVSRYFSTITFINAGLGAVTAGALQLLGVNDALVWGLVAFIANFIVYLGPAVFAVILLFVGVAEFDGARSLAPAMTYLLINTLEGQFVTPALLGRHMAVNPLLIFLSLIFGLWIWGPIGGVVAIPLLLWVLVLNDVITDRPAAAAATA